MIKIRPAREEDTPQIAGIFQATYGAHYTYPQFYDAQYLKKLVFADDAILLVAEDTDENKILGTASVILEIGAFADLLGEFGRLAVHPDVRERGIGGLLMEGRLKQVSNQLHIAITEPRASHNYSQTIACSNGFNPVGFLPVFIRFEDHRESISLFVRHFGDCLSLRKNNPTLIPEVASLAQLAMKNCDLKYDGIVIANAISYPKIDSYQISEMTSIGYSSLLRFQRGRITEREIFGPLRIHYGLFKMEMKDASYLIARKDQQIVGAIGFSIDRYEKVARIFELISLNEDPLRHLLEELNIRCDNEYDISLIYVDVNAYSPRMQQTLLELGYLPCAYIPAMVFHQVERYDIVRMLRVNIQTEDKIMLIPESEEIVHHVIKSFNKPKASQKIKEILPHIPLFDGLNEEQAEYLASTASLCRFQKGDILFEKNQRHSSIYLIIKGQVEVLNPKTNKVIAEIKAGQALGEISFLNKKAHTYTAKAKSKTKTACISHASFDQLLRRRPDIGVLVYRNLASELGNKLITANKKLKE